MHRGARFIFLKTTLPLFREPGQGGGGTQCVHGRSRMTIDPRIPIVPARSTSGLHQLRNNFWKLHFLFPRARTGGGGSQCVHGRKRMTIDPRIPIAPARSASGFHQPGRHGLHQARIALRCSASRIKGELHPRIARKTDFGTLCLRSCSRMTAPMTYFVFWCGHSRDSNEYYDWTASWVLYHIHTTWCDHFPCAELEFSTPHNMIYCNSLTSMVTAKKKKKKNGTLVV